MRTSFENEQQYRLFRGSRGVIQGTVKGEPCSAWAIYSCDGLGVWNPGQPQNGIVPAASSWRIPDGARHKEVMPESIGYDKGLIAAYLAGSFHIPSFCTNGDENNGCCRKVRLSFTCHTHRFWDPENHCNTTWTYNCQTKNWDKIFITGKEKDDAEERVRNYYDNRW